MMRSNFCYRSNISSYLHCSANLLSCLFQQLFYSPCTLLSNNNFLLTPLYRFHRVVFKVFHLGVSGVIVCILHRLIPNLGYFNEEKQIFCHERNPLISEKNLISNRKKIYLVTE